MAIHYSKDRKEPDLIENINRSITSLKKLKDEFKSANLKGKFEIYLYSIFHIVI